MAWRAAWSLSEISTHTLLLQKEEVQSSFGPVSGEAGRTAHLEHSHPIDYLVHNIRFSFSEEFW